MEPLIGFFVNTLVMRADMSGDPGFTELLGRVRQTALEAYANQDVPFERLVEELQPERDRSRNPLFQVLFVLQNAAALKVQLEGLAVETVPVPWASAKFDLTLQVEEQEGGELSGTLEYATALFDAETVERLAGHYVRVLEQLAAEPETRLSRLELMGEEEKRKLVEEWSGTEAAYPRGASIAEVFEARVEKAPEAVAVECGGEGLTYGELNRRANQLARYLRKRGEWGRR